MKAHEHFKANEDAEPEDERPKPMTYAGWRKFQAHKERAQWAKEKRAPVLETLVSGCWKQMPEDPEVSMYKRFADGAFFFS